MKTHQIKWKPSKKQLIAWQILQKNDVNEVVYGGGAGGGKSYLGCCWIVLSCLKYPHSRWLIGRAVLKALKESTILTFFQVCREWGLRRDIDFKYNSIEGVIKFLKTGSEVYLKDLAAQPSDPEFDDLGSREYTGIFIDEASEITTKAYNICKSRIRYKLEEFKLTPKILICSNPTKNFLYYDFYKKHRDGTLESYKVFLPALVQDNPFISPHYIENLKKLDKISKERLLYGNWEYDDDDTKLFEYDKILEMFNIDIPEQGINPNFLSVDCARFGKDLTVIIRWNGYRICNIDYYSKQSTYETVNCIKRIQRKHKIPNNHIICDEDGLGAGVVDSPELKGIRGFVNNSRPLELKRSSKTYTHPQIHNYSNLKTQCYFLLATYVNEGKIGMYDQIEENVKEMLIEDLEQMREKDADKDNKIMLVPKEEIKENIGRSTDFGDALMMRMIFELVPGVKPHISI